MESKDKEMQSTNTVQSPLPFQEFYEKIDKLKEIDIFGIEPLLPPTWKEGRL